MDRMAVMHLADGDTCTVTRPQIAPLLIQLVRSDFRQKVQWLFENMTPSTFYWLIADGNSRCISLHVNFQFQNGRTPWPEWFVNCGTNGISISHEQENNDTAHALCLSRNTGHSRIEHSVDMCRMIVLRRKAIESASVIKSPKRRLGWSNHFTSEWQWCVVSIRSTYQKPFSGRKTFPASVKCVRNSCPKRGEAIFSGKTFWDSSNARL